MTQTTVVHRKHAHDVYIGRKKGTANHFGNPFSFLNQPHTIRVESREACIEAFRQWLNSEPKWAHVEPKRRLWILLNMHKLRGKRLGCFCKPKGCHGDVLAEMLKN